MSLDRLLKYWACQFFSPKSVLREKYRAFKKIVQADRQAHLHMARLEEIFYHRLQVDCSRVDLIYQDLSSAVSEMVSGLQELSPGKYANLKDYFKKIDFYCRLLLAPMNFNASEPYVFLPETAEADENLLGGKGLNLNLLKNKLGLPVPDFFIITTNAFCLFLESNEAIGKIEEILSRIEIQELESLESSSLELMKLLENATIPVELQRSIKGSADLVFHARPRILVSVRSSAVAEDRESSFAGQYLTLLGVKTDDILTAYKRVIESKYTPSPLYYRIKKGYCDLETPMAVIVQEMMQTEAAGVAYSRDPDRHHQEQMTIYAVRGLGEQVVDGSVVPEIITIDRRTGSAAIVSSPGTRQAATGQEILSEEQVQVLGEWLLRLEDYFNHPADMEWCLTPSGDLKILQARMLTTPETGDRDAQTMDFNGMELILEGGTVASSGLGSGQVHLISKHEDLASAPPHAVLVAMQATPDFVETFERVSALVTEKGSAASHCASVARELGIPFLCNVTGAVNRLDEGMSITVDADNSRIYKGVAPECTGNNLRQKKRPVPDNPLFNKLKQLVKMVSKLSLLDVESSRFRPEGCRSIHDIIRFVHECAMREMFFLGGRGAHARRGARRLKGGLPMTFYVLDVGGGLKENSSGEEIGLGAVASRPMKAFWQGLSDPSVRWSETDHFAWDEFDAILLAGGIANKNSASLSSYAVLAHDYMNLSIRFGYHFVQIDALSAQDPHSNYITFRFSGGGGRPQGKLLRAAFISGILRHLGFKTESTGELVDAQMKHATQEEILKALVEIGRLVGATRLMDMYLSPDSDIQHLVEDFLKGRSDFSGEDDGKAYNEQ